MKRSLIFLYLSIFFGAKLLAQENFAEESINFILIEQINDLREENQLPVFELDEVLDAAAFDQAEYIMKEGKVLHSQSSSKKESVLDRILYYRGLHAQAGENAALLSMGSKEKLKPNGSRETIDSESKLVKAAITSWLEEEEGKLNLLDPDFFRLGTSVLIDENDQFVMVAVMASSPYQIPKAAKVDLSFHGIKPYDAEVCDPFLENHSTLPQLFSDALEVKGNEVFLTYHSLSYMSEVISSGGDGVAVDIIRDHQFDCENGNRLFPTSISDGYLLPPAKKNRIFNFNQKKEEEEVYVDIGKLPDFYRENNCELNLVIIKNGHYCETVPYNKFETRNLKWFEIPYLYHGNSDSTFFEWKDTTNITLKNPSNWKQELQTIFDQLSWMNYHYYSVSIVQKTAPIDDFISRGELSETLLNILQDSSLEVEITNEVGWKELNNYFQNTFYELETKELDSVQLKEYLREAANSDTALANFMKGLNRIELSVTGKASISKELDPESKQLLFQWMFEQNKIDAVLFLQSNLMKTMADENYRPGQFPTIDPRQKVEYLPVINNQIVWAEQNGQIQFRGNAIHLAFLELFLISKKYPEIVFNKFLSQLKYWSTNRGNIKNIEDWISSFKKLSNKGIDRKLFARSILNYYLIAADYYYEKEAFEERKEAFEGIMKWHDQSNLSNKEYLTLAQYLAHQDQLSRAIDLLTSKLKGEVVDRFLLFYLLQIGIYDREAINESGYLSLMKKAQEQFPEHFCSLFSKEKMGVQSLKNQEIKSLFCKHCSHILTE